MERELSNREEQILEGWLGDLKLKREDKEQEITRIGNQMEELGFKIHSLECVQAITRARSRAGEVGWSELIEKAGNEKKALEKEQEKGQKTILNLEKEKVVLEKMIKILKDLYKK